MPMLAEKKQKGKWSLIPTGSTTWSKDDNKIGQKMLEKMGWSKGNGLGKDLTGRTDHVRVSLKMDTKGVGFKGHQEDFSKQIDAFDDVLSNLNDINNTNSDNQTTNSDSNNADNTIQSLETKSKNSKSRVHYHKFTRGKDLSRCSESDIAGIFGSKKRSKRLEEADQLQLEEVVNSEVGTAEQDPNGVKTIHGGNLNDYFAQKMSELKKKRREGLLGGETPARPLRSSDIIPDLDFEPEKINFSFNVTPDVIENDESHEEQNKENSQHETLTKRKKKKKNKRPSVEPEMIDAKRSKKSKNKDKESSIRIPSPSCNEEHLMEENHDIPLKKKKKKKKNKERDQEPTEISNQFEQSVDSKSSKRNKLKTETVVSDTEPIISSPIKRINEHVSKPKKKKKRKRIEAEEDISEDEEIAASKKSREDKNAVEPSNQQDASKSNDLNDSYCSATQQVKKKRKICDEEINDVVSSSKLLKKASLSIFNGVEQNGKEPPKEGKKKSKLSAKKSFKMLKSDLETRFKFMTSTKTQSIAESCEGSPEKEVPLPEPKEKFVPKFPGSNITSIVGYDKSL